MFERVGRRADRPPNQRSAEAALTPWVSSSVMTLAGVFGCESESMLVLAFYPSARMMGAAP